MRGFFSGLGSAPPGSPAPAPAAAPAGALCISSAAASRPAATVYQLIQSAIGIGLRDADFLSLYDQQARGAGLALESEG